MKNSASSSESGSSVYRVGSSGSNFSIYAVGSSFGNFLAGSGALGHFCHLAVNVSELAVHFVHESALPELEVGATAEELTYTLRLFYARELDKDTAGVSELLDRRLGYTETVDTVAEDVE